MNPTFNTPAHDDRFMASDGYIPRKLWYKQKDGKKITVTQEGMLQVLGRPIVVLGEAGMGKSRLLALLGERVGYTYCTARKLINAGKNFPMLQDEVLVIDALDELNSRKEGDAVNQVIRSLVNLGCPQFILSCRVADWRGATGGEAITDFYTNAPVEMHIEPFGEDDAVVFLSGSLDHALACAVMKHFSDRGLGSLLGNPQTLELISNVAGQGNLPNSLTQLFERTSDLLWQEHKDAKADSQQSKSHCLDAVGAAFAALILTGNEVISRAALANVERGALPLTEVQSLPGAEIIASVLDTRLFVARGSDRFSYVHRRIGEFFGATWLAKRADTPRKRRRMLALFQSEGVVPASLRGIHAWLARDKALVSSVIAADPMGIIEYGDVENLGVTEAMLLLSSLRQLAIKNPWFHEWRKYSAVGLVQVALLPELKMIICSHTEPPALRALILQVMRGTRVVPDLTTELQNILLDTANGFMIRRYAGEALIGLNVHWSNLYTQLLAHRQQASARLGIELMAEIGYEHFSEEVIVDFILQHSQLPEQAGGVLAVLSTKFPIERVHLLLDNIDTRASEIRGDEESMFDLNYAIERFIKRTIAESSASAEQLWRWFQILHPSFRYTASVSDVTMLLSSNIQLRRELQDHVFLVVASQDSIRARAQHIQIRQNGLYPKEADLVALLGTLYSRNPSDCRWRDLVELAAHDGTKGAAVRDAARCFTGGDEAQLEWLEGLSRRPLEDWEIDELKTRAESRRKAEEKRQLYISRISEVRAGEYSTLLEPALIYCGEQSVEGGTNLLPVGRVSTWLSHDYVDDVLAGFDAFLRNATMVPNALQIVQAIVDRNFYRAVYILCAAIAERIRTGRGFDDLTDEKICAVFYASFVANLNSAAQLVDIQPELVVELKNRAIWEDAVRGLIEPQIRKRYEYVHGLHFILTSPASDSTVTMLANSWLTKFYDLPITVETRLVDFLFARGDYRSLNSLLLKRPLLQSDRQQLWDSVGLIVDFSSTSARLEEGSLDPNLVWSIRDRLTTREKPLAVSAELANWIVVKFRRFYPFFKHPSSSCGDMNAWDATEFLMTQIKRLGNDVSPFAVNAMRTLADHPKDGYSDNILVVQSEQFRLRVESNFEVSTIDNLVAITSDHLPVDSKDLQVFVLEELNVVQAKIYSDDTDSWRGFFDDGMQPRGEEMCRDYLIGLLRQGVSGVSFSPEAHVADDKEVDISCDAGLQRMPIEVKGQWHKALWRAADTQLDKQYASDWRAKGLGVYLVLWFGKNVQPKKMPCSAGRDLPQPSTATELEEMLRERSNSARDGGIVVFVLDLERK